MNNQLHQYPAALYSAVPEFGYRTERFTGEVLRSSFRAPHDGHRVGLFERIRKAFGGDGSRRHGRTATLHPMHEGR
jgi:hypothetical protein